MFSYCGLGGGNSREKAQKAQRGEPQAKELNHGFHGFHGLGITLGSTSFIRAIRAIRGKIFLKMNDSDGLQGKRHGCREGIAGNTRLGPAAVRPYMPCRHAKRLACMRGLSRGKWANLARVRDNLSCALSTRNAMPGTDRCWFTARPRPCRRSSPG